ncbi:hypothetical protein ACHAO2_005104 [Verticillium nonalfalfae]
MGKFGQAMQAGQTAIELTRNAQGLANAASDFRAADKRDLGRQAGHAAFSEGAETGKAVGKTWLKTFEVIPRLVCRALQLVFALIACGFYGHRVDADRKDEDGSGGFSPEWLFAVIVGGLSAVTAVAFLAAAPLSAIPVVGSRIKMFKTYRAFAWDATLFVAWIVVFGIMAGIFLGRDSDDPYKGASTGAMKTAVWVDLVNAIFWAVSAAYGCFKTFLGEKADQATDKIGKKLFEKKQPQAPAKSDGVRSLVIFFGPILLPKAYAYYQNLKKARAQAALPIRPVTRPALRTIFFLSFLAFLLVVKATPLFAPENIFALTQSRLQIPVDVLFNRLAALRPANILTPRDEALRARFVNLESRLLYFQFGPAAIADCPFCRSDDPKSYAYYALPAIIAPHLLNLIALAAAASRPFAGPHGPPWRTTVTVAATALAALDVYLVTAYNPRPNAAALRLGEIDTFHWTARSLRLVALAALDLALAAALYLSSTNRAFAAPPPAAARLERVNRALATVRSKMTAFGIVRNAGVRDEGLRSRQSGYWAHEVRIMGEVMEEREVVEGVNDAIGSGRVDIERIERDAEEYARSVLQAEEEAPVTMVG